MVLGYHADDFNRSGSPYDNGTTHFVTHTNDLFNGNIAGWTSNINASQGGQYEQRVGHKFRYDQLNRIKTSLFGYYSGGWNTTDDYKSTYTYDANGNITNLNRKGYAANPTYGREMDDFTYNRIAGTNKLEYIDDAVAAVNYGTDIDDQSVALSISFITNPVANKQH